MQDPPNPKPFGSPHFQPPVFPGRRDLDATGEEPPPKVEPKPVAPVPKPAPKKQRIWTGYRWVEF